MIERIERPLYIVTMFMLICGLGAMLYVTYLLNDPRIPTEFLEDTFRVEKTHYRKGEMVKMSIRANKNHPIPVETHWRILCGELSYPMPGFVGSANIGKNIEIKPSMWIPYYVQEGTCRFDLVAEYQLNPLKTLNIELSSEEFEVIGVQKGGPVELPKEAYNYPKSNSFLAFLNKESR